MTQAPPDPPDDVVPRDIAKHVQDGRFRKRRDFLVDARNRRRFIRRWRTSKARREKRCYDILRELGVSVPPNIDYVEERNLLGMLTYSEISMDFMRHTTDLRYVALLPEFAYLREDTAWRKATVLAVADMVKNLHAHDYFPQNLHFRNIVIDKSGTIPPAIYLIDCVSGRFARHLRRAYFRRKDLAFLYQDARAWCTLRERIAFMHRLLDTRKLSPAQRQFCQEIATYAQQKWGDAHSSLAD